MKTRLTILVLVAAAATFILWSKSPIGSEPASSVAAGPGQTPGATVLLFADPREAAESCGCAEIIQQVRDHRGAPGILVREIDSRNPGEEARRHEVRISPTVVILDATGQEHARFEGESAATIRALRSALADLEHSPMSAESNTAR